MKTKTNKKKFYRLFLIAVIVALGIISVGFAATNIALNIGTTISTGATISISDTMESLATGKASLVLNGQPSGLGTESLLQMAAAISGGSGSGTFIGVNATNFSGNFLDAMINGTSKFKVDSSGNIDLPAGAVFRINGAPIISSGWNDSGNNSYNSNSGNVGIGTSVPTSKLEIAGSVNLANSLFVANGPTMQSFTSSTLEQTTDTGHDPSMDTVGTSTIFISYGESEGGSLKFVKSTDGGATWTETIIDSTASGARTSLEAIDANTIFISYLDGDYTNLKFAKSTNGGTTWTTSSVDATITSDYSYISLAAVDANTIFIVYYDATTGNFKFAKSTNGGSSWNISNIDTGNVGKYPAISTLDANTLFVTYYDVNNGNFKYGSSTNGGTTWSSATVASTGDVGKYSSLSALNANTLFVTYFDSTNGQLKYGSSTDGGASWSISTIAAAPDINSKSSSVYALDVNNVFVSYVGSSYNLQFVKSANGGVSWTTTTVDSSTFTGYSLLMRVVDANNIFIGYQDWWNKDLRFTKTSDGGSTWNNQTPDGSGNIGQYPSIYAVDENNVFTSYYDAENGDLKFAKSSNGGVSWTGTSTPIDSTGNVGQYTAIQASDANTIFISYYDVTNANLKVAKSVNGGGAWTLYTVDSDGNVGQATSLKVIDTNTVFVSYYDVSNEDVKFAKTTNGGASWTVVTADSYNNVGQYATSIDAINSNTVFIGYYDGPVGSVKSAKSTDGGATWTTYTVGTDTLVSYKNLSLDFVNANTVFIAYQDEDPAQLLKFAKTTDGGATWTASIAVDSTSGGGDMTPSIHAVDSNTIFVSYFKRYPGYIRFAESLDGGVTWNSYPILSLLNAHFNFLDIYGINAASGNAATVFSSYYNPDSQELNFIKYSAVTKVGVGTTMPASLLEVGTSGYLQFDKTSDGAPTAADCDAGSERGRLAIDTTANRWYICNGATRGWDYINLTN